MVDRNKRTQSLLAIWNALWAYREDMIPEGEEMYDDEWNDITEAMSFIHEELDVDLEIIDD
tara:strand:+ start:327 stop:509 length:183 start_codon:yes stop_codon:yes gene_type:complete